MWIEPCSEDGERGEHCTLLSFDSWQNHGTATWPLGGHIASGELRVFHDKGFHMFIVQSEDLLLILWNICNEIYFVLNRFNCPSWVSNQYISLCTLSMCVVEENGQFVSQHISRQSVKGKELRRRRLGGFGNCALSCVHLYLSCLRCTCPQVHPAAAPENWSKITRRQLATWE